MNIANEVQAIPSDVGNLVKGDIKLGKTRVPKIALAGIAIAGVVFIALKSKGSKGGAGSLIPSSLTATPQLNEDGSTASVPNSAQSALDSILGNTTPPDASGIPLPDIPLPDFGNFGSLPSLPEFNLPQLPSIPTNDYTLPDIPYMSPDFSSFRDILSGSDSAYGYTGESGVHLNTGIVPPAYNQSIVQSIKKVVPKAGKAANPVSLIVNTKAKATANAATSTPVRPSMTNKGNTGIVPPKLNTVPSVVNYFVNGVQQFTSLVKKLQNQKAYTTPQTTTKVAAIVPVSKPPVTYNPITGSGYTIPVSKPQPVPTYIPYKPAPLPPPTNYNPYSKQSATAAANKSGSPVKVAY